MEKAEATEEATVYVGRFCHNDALNEGTSALLVQSGLSEKWW